MPPQKRLSICDSDHIVSTGKIGGSSRDHLLTRLSEGEQPGFTSRLYTDLLWRIFWINADMNNDELEESTNGSEMLQLRAITITRHASQVCHRWRQIILGSPFLWGRIIDLELLNQKTDNWRDEIVKRFQKSALYIRGTVRVPPRSRHFFERLIRDHWPQICCLNVQIKWPDSVALETWDRMGHPTDNLKSFKVIFTTPLSHTPARASILTNNAPSLREFYVQNFLFDPQVSWLSQLHILGFSCRSTPQMDISLLFEIVSAMPYLESLTLKHAILRIVFGADVWTNLTIFANIKPSQGCTFDLRCSNRSIDHAWGPELLALEHNILSRYSKSYFNSQDATELSIRLRNWTIDLDGQTHSPYPSHFRFYLEHAQLQDISSIINLLSLCQLSSITFLELDISPRIFAVAKPAITTCLQGLTSVEVIYTDSQTLEFLNIMSQGQQPFPSLEVLEVRSRGQEGNLPPNDPIIPFLQYRQSQGLPLELLDLSQWLLDDVSLMRRRKALETFRDLRVVFQGSSNSDQDM